MSSETNRRRAYLVLADGAVFNGFSMGKAGETVGEVVFNTCTASYGDMLCDPTYYGQIVAQTYPLAGNRGVDSSAGSDITANGYIAREWCDPPAETDGGVTFDEYLRLRGIVGICGIDTRRLTRLLRGKGYVNGAITDRLDDFDALLSRIRSYSIHGAVEAVTTKEKYVVGEADAEYSVAVMDYGFPRAMLGSLVRRGCRVTVYPASTAARELLADGHDGIVLSDGPGDPDDDMSYIENIRLLLASGKPVLGIGVGHQMLVLAVGGRIEKLPHAHRGSNQPVRIAGTDSTMVTTQNHGYNAAEGSVPEDAARVSLTNVNDGTIEGLRYLKFPGLSVQFTPDDNPVYSDTAWVYDDFAALMKEGCDR